MPRPKKAIRPVEKRISVPEDVAAQVDFLLYSDVEGRVPHGAWARLVTELLKQEIVRRKAHAEDFGL